MLSLVGCKPEVKQLQLPVYSHYIPVAAGHSERAWIERGPAAFEFEGRAGDRIRLERGQGSGVLDAIVLVQRRGAWEFAARTRLPARRVGHLELPVNARYRLVVRGESGASGALDLRLGSARAYVFPVRGRDSAAVRSRFGASRDGGRRSHKGVDIFAPRGTPVLASRTGVIRKVANRGLGGKQVWLHSEDGMRFYYAHLDRIEVKSGQRVRAGEVLGTVGTTGNARGMSPHLHFGVYLPNVGAVDPLRYQYSTVAWAPVQASEHAQVAGHRLNLRRAPGLASTVVSQLPEGAVLKVMGVTGGWLRVRDDSGAVGYVAADYTRPA